MRYFAAIIPASAICGCVVVVAPEAGDEASNTSDGMESSTGGADSPCHTPLCEITDPCATIDCTEPLYHDSQIVFAWSQPGSDCTSGCHAGPSPSATLSLMMSDDPWCSIVDQPSSVAGIDLVEPGDPARSYLWHKLAGTQGCRDIGGSGSGMPPLPNSCPLAERDPLLFETITAWICCGAFKSSEDPLGEGCA